MGLRVTQRRSAIGARPSHRGTLRALGLGRIGKSHVLPDRPEIRGMIAAVPHLVDVEEVAEEPTPRTAVRARAVVAKPDEDKGQA